MGIDYRWCVTQFIHTYRVPLNGVKSDNVHRVVCWVHTWSEVRDLKTDTQSTKKARIQKGKKIDSHVSHHCFCFHSLKLSVSFGSIFVKCFILNVPNNDTRKNKVPGNSLSQTAVRCWKTNPEHHPYGDT